LLTNSVLDKPIIKSRW